MVNMSSGMDHGRVRPATMSEDDEVGQHCGHNPANKPTESSLQTGSWGRMKKYKASKTSQ